MFACACLILHQKTFCEGDYLGKDNFCDDPFECAAKLTVQNELNKGTCYIEEKDGIKYLKYK